MRVLIVGALALVTVVFRNLLANSRQGGQDHNFVRGESSLHVIIKLKGWISSFFSHIFDSLGPRNVF